MITLKALIHLIDVPLACMFLLVGITLSFINNFPQFKKFKEFLKILHYKKSQESTSQTLSPLHALYTAMSTSLGMGNIISPAVAIAIGGPGALFWMIMYAIFGSATKYTEVFFAVKYKRFAKDGSIIGGPTGYLYQVHPLVAHWYGIISIFLFSAWSALQSKTLAVTYAHYGIKEWITGTILALFVFLMLTGGTKTIGKFASRLIPLLFVFYLSIACFIIFKDLTLFKEALKSIFTHAFTATAPIGGFIGSTALMGLRQGIFKGAFTTEAGVGTAAIPHAYADTQFPKQQAILGMYSIFMNTFLCLISGFVALVTNIWQIGTVSNDLAFKAFGFAIPNYGPIALTATITICIIGATLGNSFNGSKCFGFFTNNKYLSFYYVFICLFILMGAIVETSTLWDITDLLLPLIAVPNMIGIIILALKHRKELIG